MKPRLTALLIHGMGSEPGWWAPLLPPLEALGIKPIPLSLPSLETAGPEAWVQAAVDRSQDIKLVMGHSLGAAVALKAAERGSFAGIVLLAMPTLTGPMVPAPPKNTGLSATALARVGRFILETQKNLASGPAETVHLAGAEDPFVAAETARRLPFPLRLLPKAGHDLTRFPSAVIQITDACARLQIARQICDPGARLLALAEPPLDPAPACELNSDAPSPVRLDLEITNRCPLACARCARPFYKSSTPPADLDWSRFQALLQAMPLLEELFFVGLGEPLLHPRLEEYVGLASREGIRCKIITNGLLATPERLASLQADGLAEITFSLDTLDPDLFAELRGGASLKNVLENFQRVPEGLIRSIFVALSQHNLAGLPRLIDFAAECRLPGLGVSDVNFPHNQSQSLHAQAGAAAVSAIIRHARSRGVTLMGPHFHNTGLHPRAWRHVVVNYPSDLTGRSARHRRCLAPWRIAVVNAEGTLSPCNCAPDIVLPLDRFPDAWNGPSMRDWRQSMMEARNPHCQQCPRY
jgi:MoaA/NifB/PqqE/SkfB family radical SAM enzyme